MPAVDALTSLLALLDLETIDPDIYRGAPTTAERDRAYGGHVAAQAVVAAGRTVPDDRPLHSLHAYFMRAGDPAAAIVYDVDRLRDGRSFTTRRVRARQHGRNIFSLEASFQVVEPDGLHHEPVMPDSPDPESLAPMVPIGDDSGEASRWGEIRALDFRAAPDPAATPDVDVPSHFWFRPTGPVEGDHLLHAAVLTYASDYALLSNVLRRHGRWFRDDDLMVASLDHAMWFHTTPRVEDWMLYEVTSPAAGGSRGLGIGRIYGRSGTLMCTTAQEGLARVLDRPRPR